MVSICSRTPVSAERRNSGSTSMARSPKVWVIDLGRRTPNPLAICTSIRDTPLDTLWEIQNFSSISDLRMLRCLPGLISNPPFLTDPWRAFFTARVQRDP
jgi:hypothetical protein